MIDWEEIFNSPPPADWEREIDSRYNYYFARKVDSILKIRSGKLSGDELYREKVKHAMYVVILKSVAAEMDESIAFAATHDLPCSVKPGDCVIIRECTGEDAQKFSGNF